MNRPTRELSKLVKIAIRPEDLEKIEMLRTVLTREGMVDRDWLMPLVEEYLAEHRGELGRGVVFADLNAFMEQNHQMSFSRAVIQIYRDSEWVEGQHYFKRLNGKKSEVVYILDQVVPFLLERKETRAGRNAQRTYQNLGLIKAAEKTKKVLKHKNIAEPIESEAKIRAYRGSY